MEDSGVCTTIFGYFREHPFWQHNNRKTHIETKVTPKRARWKQAPEKNSELLSENGKRQIQNQCQHVLFCKHEKHVRHDLIWNVTSMIFTCNDGNFLIPTPSFWDVFWWNIFVFMKTIKAKPPKQDCLGPPVEIVGSRVVCRLSWQAALWKRRFTVINCESNGHIRFQGNTALTLKGSLPFLPYSWNHVENCGP